MRVLRVAPFVLCVCFTALCVAVECSTRLAFANVDLDQHAKEAAVLGLAGTTLSALLWRGRFVPWLVAVLALITCAGAFDRFVLRYFTFEFVTAIVELQRLPQPNGALVARRLDPGPIAPLFVEVRTERTLAPGVLLVHTLACEPAESVAITPLDAGRFRLLFSEYGRDRRHADELVIHVADE